MSSSNEYHADVEFDALLDDRETNLPRPNGQFPGTILAPRVYDIKNKNLGRPILFHIIFALTYASVIFLALKWSIVESSLCYPHIYSPATDFKRYEAATLDGLLNGNDYIGPPGPTSDAAWAFLLEGSNIRILPEEMEKLGLTSLAMRDGSGYLGSLGVYHELHCVKRIQQWLYRDYYFPNETGGRQSENFAHTEHCLESLRQYALCHGDITIQPFQWLRDEEGHVLGPTIKGGAIHECANWDRLSSWAKARRVDIFDRNTLVSPNFE